jgi:hypothetical protein
MDENRNLLPIGYSWNTGDAEEKSGYTWDSYVGPPGILAACRHSHDVAKKFNEGCRRKSVSIERWNYCKRVFAPQTIGGCQVIDLRYDICCITSDSWESLLRHWRPIFLRTKDARGRIRTEKSLNIGIKFDPAWNEELDKATQAMEDGLTHDVLLRDLSPRLAFVIRLLIQLAPRGYYEETKLMLIDDVSKWQFFDVKGHSGSQIFDGDQEYVEIVPITRSGFHIPMECSPIHEFMDYWETYYLRRWVGSSKSGNWESLLDSWFFCPLLRRENYVPGRPK